MNQQHNHKIWCIILGLPPLHLHIEGQQLSLGPYKCNNICCWWLRFCSGPRLARLQVAINLQNHPFRFWPFYSRRRACGITYKKGVSLIGIFGNNPYSRQCKRHSIFYVRTMFEQLYWAWTPLWTVCCIALVIYWVVKVIWKNLPCQVPTALVQRIKCTFRRGKCLGTFFSASFVVVLRILCHLHA